MFLLRFLILFACVCTLSLTSFIEANAQQSSLTISPAFVEATVKRGTTYSKVFTIFNDTQTRYRIRPTLTDFWYGDHNQRIYGQPGTLPHSASLWLQLSPAEIVVEPKGTATIRAMIAVPQAVSGTYYTMPIFAVEPADHATQTHDPKSTTLKAAISFQLRGLLILTADDAPNYKVEVAGGEVVPPTDSSELQLNLKVRNSGATQTRTRGMYAILDTAGKLAGRGTMNEKRLMPGQQSSLTSLWAGSLAKGNYTAIVTLTYDRTHAEPATLIREIPFEVK